MKIKKIGNKDSLNPALVGLDMGETLEIPFKLFSEKTIRATASQIKANGVAGFEVNARGDKAAYVTRIS
ncbi:MAG: hypothetical protein K2O78_08315 [Muribaculaceae bacterium]|nr:hypothetical protein [Muribaculaceae bacterium]